MDRIIIRDLLVMGIIGVHDWEREKPQDILINVEMYADLHKACVSDTIEDTISYSAVAQKIVDLVEIVGRYTVEALAEDIANLCLENPQVIQVKVRVEKPGAVRITRSVGVEIERFRSG